MDHISQCFPLPPDESIIPYAHFLFSCLTNVRLGIMDGQHRYCALLSLLFGMSLKSQPGSPPIQWVQAFASENYVHPRFKGDKNILKALLKGLGSHSIQLLVPHRAGFQNQFSKLQEAANQMSYVTDQTQLLKHGESIGVGVFRAALDQFCRRAVEINFGTVCSLHHFWDYGITIHPDGSLSPTTKSSRVVNKQIVDFIDPDYTWLSDGGISATLFNLAQYDILCTFHDTKTLMALDNPSLVEEGDLLLKWNLANLISPSCIVEAYHHEKALGSSVSTEINDEEKSRLPGHCLSKSGEWLSTITKNLPPYALSYLDEICSTAIWKSQHSIGRLPTSGQNNPGLLISVPALIAFHDSRQFLNCIISVPKFHGPVLSWALARFNKPGYAPEGSPLHGYKNWFLARSTTNAERISSLSHFIFFVDKNKKFGSYNVEKFSSEEPLPMFFPKFILSFARFVGLIAHHPPWVTMIQSLFWWDFIPEMWEKIKDKDRLSIYSTVSLAADVSPFPVSF